MATQVHQQVHQQDDTRTVAPIPPALLRSPMTMFGVRRSLAHALGKALAEGLRCATCGKLTTIANTAGYRQRFAGERVTAETHCACVGGPAAARCATCGGHGEIDAPNQPVAASYEDRLALGPIATVPCPDCGDCGGARS